VLNALHRIATPEGRAIGLAPGDTGHVVFAQVADVTVRGMTRSGAPLAELDAAHWSVAFKLSNSERAVEFQLAKQTGTWTILKTEPFDTTTVAGSR
jgi:hypothetical protein